MFAIGFTSFILPSLILLQVFPPVINLNLLDSHIHVLHCCRFRLLGFFLCRPVSTCRPWVCLGSYRSTPSSNTASLPSLSHVCVRVCVHASTISILTLECICHPSTYSNCHSISCSYASHASHASHRPRLPCQATVLPSSGPCANRIGHHDITGLCGSLQRPILLFVVLCDV